MLLTCEILPAYEANISIKDMDFDFSEPESERIRTRSQTISMDCTSVWLETGRGDRHLALQVSWA